MISLDLWALAARRSFVSKSFCFAEEDVIYIKRSLFKRPLWSCYFLTRLLVFLVATFSWKREVRCFESSAGPRCCDPFNLCRGWELKIPRSTKGPEVFIEGTMDQKPTVVLFPSNHLVPLNVNVMNMHMFEVPWLGAMRNNGKVFGSKFWHCPKATYHLEPGAVVFVCFFGLCRLSMVWNQNPTIKRLLFDIYQNCQETIAKIIKNEKDLKA